MPISEIVVANVDRAGSDSALDHQITDSAAALGLEGLCFALPIAVLPLLAGPTVDGFDRVKA